MKPIERSSTVAATPETIWKTCFEPMKWESWDPDVKECKDVSGACENGTTFTFVMNDGTNFPIVLSNVEKNKSLTFTGAMAGGLLGATGTVLISAVDATTSKIDYSFKMTGFVGGIVGFLKKKEGVKGTEEGLANMVKLSEEAQK